MDEGEVRLALLEAELSSLESGIRGFDTVAFQVKGWCVTALLAIAGFAANDHKELLPIGAVAVIGFWLVESQNRHIQRRFFVRNSDLRAALEANPMTPLEAGAPVLSVGIPVLFPTSTSSPWSLHHVIAYTRGVVRAGLQGHTLGLYLFLLLALGIEYLII